MGMTHEVLSLDGLTNPFSNMGAPETSSTNMAKEAQESSTPNKEKEVDVGKKRKHNQVALVLEDYLEFKKEQAKRAVGKIVEASRHEIDTSISKCIATIESIQELTDEEKAKALGLFRCPLNREIFMNTSIPSVFGVTSSSTSEEVITEAQTGKLHKLATGCPTLERREITGHEGQGGGGLRRWIHVLKTPLLGYTYIVQEFLLNANFSATSLNVTFAPSLHQPSGDASGSDYYLFVNDIELVPTLDAFTTPVPTFADGGRPIQAPLRAEKPF
uniref:Uncharacterized protein n=1 Tax=Oryza brachyantha TaxID=4533 RepID=J3LX45_ORYBR